MRSKARLNLRVVTGMECPSSPNRCTIFIHIIKSRILDINTAYRRAGVPWRMHELYYLVGTHDMLYVCTMYKQQLASLRMKADNQVKR